MINVAERLTDPAEIAYASVKSAFNGADEIDEAKLFEHIWVAVMWHLANLMPETYPLQQRARAVEELAAKGVVEVWAAIAEERQKRGRDGVSARDIEILRDQLTAFITDTIELLPTLKM